VGAVRCAGFLLLGLSGALAACGSGPRSLSRTQPTRRAALAGPAPRGRSAESAESQNRECERCHSDIAAEWRGSLHARSQTDAVYTRAFALEPLEFCQACHAPEADPKAPVPEAAADIGVGCVTCHVVQDELLARADATGARSAPHALTRDARLDGSAACSGCHEFAFPDRTARRRPELMQATVSEHATSTQSESVCASCHMPLVEHGAVPHKSHAFAGGHDTELVRSAVSVTAERSREGARITLTPRQVGHAFPTGDLFRRVEVSAEAVGSEWQVVASKSRYLARHWQRLPSPFGVVLRGVVRDDRPLDAAVVVELELGPSAAQLPINWRVAYQRVEHPRSEREQDSRVEGEIEIASGALEKKP
jgi:hypothetical protein